MILREESTFAEELITTSSIEPSNRGLTTTNYKDLLGLSYDNLDTSTIPSRLKWCRGIIRLVE